MGNRFNELDETHQGLVVALVNTIASIQHLMGAEVIDEIVTAAVKEIHGESREVLNNPILWSALQYLPEGRHI